MRVLFDTQIFDWQISGGISRYFVEVLKRLEQDENVEPLFNCIHSYNTYIQDSPWLAHQSIYKGIDFKGKLLGVKRINEMVNRRASNKLLQAKIPDIFHPTYFDPYFLKRLNGVPFVLTVHDLTNEKYFDHRSLTKKVLRWKKDLIAAADCIIAVSENTKKDIVEYYQIDPKKITTVYLSGGLQSNYSYQAAELSVIQKINSPYLLFVGSRTGYKNFIGCLKEIAPIIQQEKIKLVVAGGGNFNAAEQQLIQKLSLENRIILLPHVSDKLLSAIYQHAMVFIFPSLYEGFGIPVLEAMQCGCPVLLSNNSSLPEVGGSAAAYFDPLHASSLFVVLGQLISDEVRRGRMSFLGKQQALKFNWDKTAKCHVEVYKKLI